MTMTQRLQSKTSQRGVAAVEFAIMLSFVLVPLTFGITELGRATYQYNTMTKGVRDAARYLSTVTPDTQVLAAQCVAITGLLANNGSACSNPVLVPGLTLSNVDVCDRVRCFNSCNLVPVVVSGVSRGTVNLVKVTISRQPFVPLVGLGISSFTFGPISATFAVKS